MTVLGDLIVTVHVVPDDESQSVHPSNAERRAGVAVRVTTVPYAKSIEQADPQLIWLGLPGLDVDVTVPLPMPSVLVFVTVSRTITVKLLALVAVPPGVVTLIGPGVAPDGTVAWIVVGELTVYVALTPLNVTDVAPVKLVPLIWTLVPTGPLAGLKFVIVGGLSTVKLLELIAVPPGVVTRSGPVAAPEGTLAWISVADVTV